MVVSGSLERCVIWKESAALFLSQYRPASADLHVLGEMLHARRYSTTQWCFGGGALTAVLLHLTIAHMHERPSRAEQHQPR